MAKLIGQWAEQLADARASGRAKLQARLVALAHRDGPGAIQAAKFLNQEHVSLAKMDREVIDQGRRLRAMSSRELRAEMEQIMAKVADPP